MITNEQVNTDLAKRMNSLEIALRFVCKELWDEMTDGDDPDIEKIVSMLKELGIDYRTIFTDYGDEE